MRKITILLFIFIIHFSKTGAASTPVKVTDNSIIVINNKYVFIKPMYILKNISDDFIDSVYNISSDSIFYKNDYSKLTNLDIDLEQTNLLNKCSWYDFNFLQNVNPDSKKFYLVDGIPMNNYKQVLSYLICREIVKLEKIGVNESIAIWGKRLGKNGAYQIVTKKRKNEKIIPVINNLNELSK